jgi:maltoporin
MLSQDYKKDGLDIQGQLHAQPLHRQHRYRRQGLGIEQLWAEVKGIDLLPAATFWIGKERGRRGDMHIVDTFFEMKGVGAGVKGITALGGKLGVAF